MICFRHSPTIGHAILELEIRNYDEGRASWIQVLGVLEEGTWYGAEIEESFEERLKCSDVKYYSF